jgi:hypothetical protein
VQPNVIEAQRPRVVDQQTEDAPAARQVSDRGTLLGVDAARQEALELSPVLVQGAKRGEARAGQLLSRSQHAIEDWLKLELRDEPASYLKQPSQAVSVEALVVQNVQAKGPTRSPGAQALSDIYAERPSALLTRSTSSRGLNGLSA